jgi:hypothetical protein
MIRALSHWPARIGLTIVLAVAALILTAFLDARPDSGSNVGNAVRFEQAGAGPWCGPADGLGARSCRYSTFEHCLAAASSDYRTCRPNPAALVVPDDATYWTYRSVFL